MEYRKIFKNVSLKQDSKASGRWETNHEGEYFGAGTGGAITGRGADLLIIDDPHSEQNINDTAFENAYNWYLSGPRQRLQPGGAIIIVMTRWSERDLTGRLIKLAGENNADEWEVIEFPAILPSGKPIWPEYWKLEELEKIKANLPVMSWEAQYQQQPTSEIGAIVKREWWKIWKKDQVPPLQHVIQSYDTAFSKKDTADFSAISTWGVFRSEFNKDNIILLDCIKDRWEFPELKKVALEQYKYWEPETIIVEAKASGQPLIQELRQVGIPVVSFSPSKGNDKISRVNAVAPLFESGVVWAPEKHFAEEMIEECAAFPYGEYDDLVDTMTQALMRYRQGNFISLNDDYEDQPREKKKYVYY
jgi:predicted phage terminase large subunit-like protein